MNYRAILKPLLAISGVTDLHIRLDGEARQVIATGKRHGRPFTKAQSFADVEATLNGDSTAPDQQTAAGPPHSTDPARIRPPEQS